jgi:2-polyprenyl-6-methoxyphenol hydroxylase-like FAD-dependent oxidoreductase
MGDVIVLGAGPVGLAAAMLLAKDGHDVTVLEKDTTEVPANAEDAWSWERGGVAQFRLAHYMQAKFRHLLDAELPDVRDEIAADGGLRHSLLVGFASTLEDTTPRPDDDRFETLTARRPVLEGAIARVAQRTMGVTILKGVAVESPIANGSALAGVPHVVGVRTSDGREFRADLVLDAMGRRSKIGEWIAGLGGRPPYEEASDAGFVYYSRYFRSRDGGLPEVTGPLPLTHLSTLSLLSLPADNDTWVVGIVCSSGDQPLKVLRRNEVWERVVRSVPHLAHWIDAEPLHDVLPMGGVVDRYRRFVLDGDPVVTGLFAIGDAWACTNPQAGRGISTGLTHAVALRDAIRAEGDGPAALARTFDALTEERCTPWYRTQVDRDHVRYAQIAAAIEGREPPASDDPAAKLQAAFAIAAAYDPDVARAFLEMMTCQTQPKDVLGRPGLVDKILEVSSTHPPPQAAGPSRGELLELVS